MALLRNTTESIGLRTVRVKSRKIVFKAPVFKAVFLEASGSTLVSGERDIVMPFSDGCQKMPEERGCFVTSTILCGSTFPQANTRKILLSEYGSVCYYVPPFGSAECRATRGWC